MTERTYRITTDRVGLALAIRKASVRVKQLGLQTEALTNGTFAAILLRELEELRLAEALSPDVDKSAADVDNSDA